MERDYNDPKYREFHKKVIRRDGAICQWPNCGSRKQPRVHHIRTWAKYPSLRYEPGNGIVLCKRHHDAIWGQEEHYVRLFVLILQSKGRHVRSEQSSSFDTARSSNKRKTRKQRQKDKSFLARYLKAKAKQRKK